MEKFVTNLKISFLTSILFLLSISSHAQSNPDLSILSGQRKIAFEINYSEGIYGGLDEADRMVEERGEENWNKAKSEVKVKFIESFTESLVKRSVILKDYSPEEAEYRITMIIDSVSPKGNVKAQINVTKNGTSSILQSFEIYGKGGKFGTFVNLFGDGMKSCGKKLARLM